MKVTPEEFLEKEYEVPVVCQIGPQHYVRHSEQVFDFNNFVYHPEDYHSDFLKYTRVTDIFIVAHYWDPRSPVFYTREDVERPDFRISVIGDISCDIGGPIANHQPPALQNPSYGYHRAAHCEEEHFVVQHNRDVY